MNLTHYNKFFVALVAAVMIGVTELTGFEWPFMPEAAVDFVIAIIGAIVVWAVPNKPA